MDTTALIVLGSIGLTLLAFNAVLLGIIFFTQRKANLARDWPMAPGTIKYSTIHKTHPKPFLEPERRDI